MKTEKENERRGEGGWRGMRGRGRGKVVREGKREGR